MSARDTVHGKNIIMFPQRHFISTMFGLLLCLPGLTVAEIDYTALPDLGSKADVAISPHLERRISRAVLRQVSSVLYDDPHASEFMNDMGRKLLLASAEDPDKFTFVIINDTRINAFAAPGGVVGMNIGIFLHAEEQSELAAVTAHEIAHVTQKHIARSYSRRGGLQALALASFIVGILLSTADAEAGRAAVMLGQAGVIQSQIDYTRENEKEADRVGMQVLAKSGYDPHGMSAFFGRLLRQGRFYSQSVAPEFLRTHPLTENRIAESEQLADIMEITASEVNNLDFLMVKAGLQLRHHSPPRQAAIFFREKMKSLPPGDAGHKAARYGMAMALIEARDYAAAGPLVQAMLTEDDNRLEYQVAAGLLQLRQGKLIAGLRHLRQARSRHPEHSWPIMLEAAALLNNGEASTAQRILRDYGRFRERKGIAYYELLSRAEEEAGFPAESALALAEVKYLQGKTKSAMRLLRAAQGVSGLSSYQRKRLQARIVELKREYELEKKFKIEEKDKEEEASLQG